MYETFQDTIHNIYLLPILVWLYLATTHKCQLSFQWYGKFLLSMTMANVNNTSRHDYFICAFGNIDNFVFEFDKEETFN